LTKTFGSRPVHVESLLQRTPQPPITSLGSKTTGFVQETEKA